MSIKPQNHVNWHKRALITWWRRASMSDSMSYDPKYTLLRPHMISSKPEPSFQQDVNNFLSVYLETLPYHQVIKSLLTSIWLLMFLQIIQHFILSYTWWWHVLLIKKTVFSKVLNGKNLGNAIYYVNIAVCTVYDYATSTLKHRLVKGNWDIVN